MRQMNPKQLIILILSVVFLQYTFTIAAEEYPVRWTEHVKIKNLKDIDRLSNEPVDMSQSGGELELINDNGDKVKVTTCIEYWDYKEKGYRPYTTYDRTMEAWFIDTCGPLKYLKNAKPSKVSYVSDFDLTENPLQTLPCTLDLNLSGDERDRAREFIAKGLTWKDFSPDKTVKIIDKNQIRLEDDSSITQITLSAFGDFNNDSIEDILLSVGHHVKEGSYGDYGHSILTRLKKNGTLRILEGE